MKRLFLSTMLLVLSAATLVACGGEASVPSTPTQTTGSSKVLPVGTTTQQTTSSEVLPVATITQQSTAGQDERITVQHILIGFKDAVGFRGQPPPKAAARTQADAKKLADEVFAKVKAGGDFDKLVVEYTDDSPPGIYSMVNNGVAPQSTNELERGRMVSAFGDVGFGLKVGEVGMAEYDAQKSPFGYHIIKRITPPPPPTPETKPAGEDDRISVQHILIGFKDAVGFRGQAPPKALTRTQEQAKTLAYEILAKVKAGEDFNALVTQYTDDSPPGIYALANKGVTPASKEEFPRSGMVPAFGDVGFGLKVGEIGMAEYDPQKSPFGYHIIKRVK